MTAAEVVAAFARFDPVRVAPEAGSVSIHWNRCVICGARGRHFDPPPEFPHDPDCLWLAARKVASCPT